MPVEEFGGGPLKATPKNTRGLRRRKPGQGAAVIAPGGRAPVPSSTVRSSAVGSGAGSSSSSSKGKGGAATSSASASGGMSAYEKRAIARENEAKAKAAKRYQEQAAMLEVQARALRHALSRDFKRALRQKLENVGEVLADQQKIVREGYRDRVKQLEGSALDNEKAAAQQSGINEGNRVRERNSAIAEATMQGAGETDLLQAQMMSLRNWQANQGEVTRGFFDTLRSINSSLADLNVDTKTALTNNQIQANADREQLWTNYYNQRSETYTQLGNVLGQKGDYLSMAKEMGAKTGPKQAKKGAGAAFMKASKELGKAWDNPGASKKLMAWEGRESFKGDNNLAQLQSARTVSLDKRPEGATLRKW